MRVLVTGGAGFVGTNLIKRLLSDGHEVISVDNYSTGKYENHQKGCDYYRRDLSNSHWWSLVDECLCEVTCECNIKPVDIIYHLAARARIVPSFEDPISTFKSNALATQNVLEWARKHNTPVIYAGTSSIHGDKYSNPYTFTKHQGEELINLYGKTFNLPTAICRFYNVYGPHQLTEGDYCCVLGIFERQFKRGEPLTITGDGEQRRDFTHVEDIADGLYRIALSKHKHEDAWELGTGKNHSINELYSFFKERYPEAESKYIDDLPGNYRFTLRQNDDTLEKLNWNPTDRLKEYITNL